MTPTATTPAVLAACLADVCATLADNRDALASPHGEVLRGGHVLAVPGGLTVALADGTTFGLRIEPTIPTRPARALSLSAGRVGGCTRRDGAMDSLSIDGTTYPVEAVRAALRSQERATRLQEAAVVALAVADVQRAARGRLSSLDSPVARRLLAALDDAEAQAWAQLGGLVGAEADDGPRVPRRD